MSRGLSILESQLLARSLKVTRSTHLLVASVTAAVASSATLAMQFTGPLGEIAMSAVIFASLALGTWAISSEIFSRSSQTISNLRSIGATRRSLSSAVLMPVLVYGLAGSALGAVIGVGLGLALGGFAGAIVLLLEVVAVILASSVASFVGVYVGGRAAWRS